MEVDSETKVAATFDETHNNASENSVEEGKIRDNAIHFVGVDDMNTHDIEVFLTSYYNRPFQIEWIDDTSLNIVYDDPEDAFQSLVAVTASEEFERTEPIAPGELRKTKPHPKHKDAPLRARFALDTDKKVTGSRMRSRYYLLHGEPTRHEDLARFGSRRSKPMKYGREILTKSRREDRAGDLFPEKAPTVSLEDSKVADLFEDKIKTKHNRRGRGRNSKKSRQPDLFADKLKGPKKASDDRSGDSMEIVPETPSASSNVFQNMNY